MSKPDPGRHSPGEVDGCLAAQAPGVRGTLEQLRALINAAAPGCTERVSYKIPIFRQGTWSPRQSPSATAACTQ